MLKGPEEPTIDPVKMLYDLVLGLREDISEFRELTRTLSERIATLESRAERDDRWDSLVRQKRHLRLLAAGVVIAIVFGAFDLARSLFGW